jgi:hypothetical protein
LMLRCAPAPPPSPSGERAIETSELQILNSRYGMWSWHVVFLFCTSCPGPQHPPYTMRHAIRNDVIGWQKSWCGTHLAATPNVQD